ncbi:MAG TPA: thioredoxin domain-containing protein [Thermodesulfobacteriota bacterium]|nr:thioredoxin domain-containing protein [Thermodesulfobacteriota bacterium]
MKILLSVIIALAVGTIALNAWILSEVSNIKASVAKQDEEIAKLSKAIAARPAAPAAQPAAADPQNVKVSIDDDPIKGDLKAPVTIVEFSDYECPFCKRNHDQVFSQIKKEYIDTGKVRYVFRDYPLGFHKKAIPAAIAANCAGEQGKYWEINDFLFQSKANLSDEKYIEFAKNNNLDMEKYQACLKDKKQEAEVDKDFKDGQAYGVRGTPSFFIGKTQEGKEMTGAYIRGARPFDAFKTEIDKILSAQK